MKVETEISSGRNAADRPTSDAVPMPAARLDGAAGIRTPVSMRRGMVVLLKPNPTYGFPTADVELTDAPDAPNRATGSSPLSSTFLLSDTVPEKKEAPVRADAASGVSGAMLSTTI